MQKKKKTSLSRSRSLALTRKPWRTCTDSTARAGSLRLIFVCTPAIPLGHTCPFRSLSLTPPITTTPVLHEATKPLQLHEVNLLCSALLFHFRTCTTHHQSTLPASHRNTKSIHPFGSSINEILLSPIHALIPFRLQILQGPITKIPFLHDRTCDSLNRSLPLPSNRNLLCFFIPVTCHFLPCPAPRLPHPFEKKNPEAKGATAAHAPLIALKWRITCRISFTPIPGTEQHPISGLTPDSFLS
ncbi:hypothetical protein EDB84DRAFT_873443 [Lactarius hengduanensis]|nr:hypothetical protein EDB84DRAFT_873443 [Lactarius hengduanensis]